ncbi:MAG: hypothetical protein ACJ0CN_00075 [Candidatus Poseidoniaceae archaeon]
MQVVTIAEHFTAILGQFLDYVASDEEVSDILREMARIGSDVIAASMQADQIARWSLNGFGDPKHDSRPLGVFAMTRSSVYGLHYLYNIKNVRNKTKTRSIEKFLKDCEKCWNTTLLSEKFGSIDLERNERLENWNKLSEIVHIIPTIREKGGFISNKVDFSFENKLEMRSKHALLPEFFNEEGRDYLNWRAKIAIGCVISFKIRFLNSSRKRLTKNLYMIISKIRFGKTAMRI